MEDIHQSVLLDASIDYLAPVSGGTYVDGNLGLGGHAEQILEKSGPNGKLIGFDLDLEALALARERLARFDERVRYIHNNFATLKETLMELGIDKIDGLLLDLGLSSLQLDKSGRGFSFKGSEPLDMRMNQQGGTTAADIVNTGSQDDLADIFYYFGEERQSRRIAARIVEERKKEPIRTTDRLADIVYQSVPKRFHPKKIHVATKVFQALRIAVNHELDSLQQILRDAPPFLKAGGRFCVISFHSLEDRLVKRAFLEDQALRVVTKKPVVPQADECRINPRARSAKLRVAEAVEV